MATTEQRLEQLGAKGPRTRHTSDAGARYRLSLALAGLAALVAWGLFDQLSDQHARANQAGQTAPADRLPHYDGHGKWGGYTP